jgi:hypothetical protein
VNTLQSSALPLDAGGFVVTVVAPSRSTFQALLRAINTVNPDAFSPVPVEVPESLVDAYIERAESDDSDMGLKAGEEISYGGTAE